MNNEKLPLEEGDVYAGHYGRAPGDVEVGAGARLPLGLYEVLYARGPRLSGRRVHGLLGAGGHPEVMRRAREHGCSL
jgi:hypothetical protein